MNDARVIYKHTSSLLPMFENVIQTNGTQSWKWVTITGRVFIDNADLEAGVADSGRSAVDVFEELASDRIIKEVLPHSDEPFKFDAISFDDDEPAYRKPPRDKQPF